MQGFYGACIATAAMLQSDQKFDLFGQQNVTSGHFKTPKEVWTMSTLLDRPVQVCRTVTTSLVHAHALEDPVRVKILEVLYRKSLSTEQIANNLLKSGYKKATTTIRHHLEVLKETGLIEIVKIQETRGAITKYYGTSIKLLEYGTPKDFGVKYATTIKSTAERLENVFQTLATETARGTRSKKADKAYSQYVMMEIVNRAMTSLIEKRDPKPKAAKRSTS